MKWTLRYLAINKAGDDFVCSASVKDSGGILSVDYDVPKALVQHITRLIEEAATKEIEATVLQIKKDEQ